MHFVKKKKRVSFSVPKKPLNDAEPSEEPEVSVSVEERTEFETHLPKPKPKTDKFNTAEVNGETLADSNVYSISDGSESETEQDGVVINKKENIENGDAVDELNSDGDKPACSEPNSNEGDDSDRSGENRGNDVNTSDKDGINEKGMKAEFEAIPSIASASDIGEDLDHPADTPKPVKSFSELSLDPRLERAIERAGWNKPTSVQAAVIPLALNGRHILVSAPTGSGKTASYAIPVVQHVCRVRSTAISMSPTLRAVVFVPTRELVHQVTVVLENLCRFIEGLHVSSVSTDQNCNAYPWKRAKASEKSKGGSKSVPHVIYRTADIVVGTPSSINSLQHTANDNPLHSVQFVVVDEADLVLSYGYEKDIKAALAAIPSSAQAMLLSATLEAEGMDTFRKAVLRCASTVKVTSESDGTTEGIFRAAHYVARLKCHRDRFLVTYAMLRLNVLCGKVLIFANSINTAFRLKLFLDQFKVKSAVLNSELPANSRIHCVQQFNAGIFDILIAADESNNEHENKSAKDSSKKLKISRKRKGVERDEEFGLSRGVDFKDVAVILNFDVPKSEQSYTHRAGRTARGGKSGTVLSLLSSDKEESMIMEIGKKMTVHIGPLAFRMEQVEALRYRVEDCLKMVTDNAIQGARLADVRREMINSEHLKGHFEENPEDLDALQHNLRLAKNIPEHLGHIPGYLLPPGMRNNLPKAVRVAVGSWKSYRVNRRRGSGNGKADPLRGFSLAKNSRQRFQIKKNMKKGNRISKGKLATKSQKLK